MSGGCRTQAWRYGWTVCRCNRSPRINGELTKRRASTRQRSDRASGVHIDAVRVKATMKQDVTFVQVRKKTVAIQAVDANGHALPGASVSIQQKRSGFPLGCALKSTILQSSAYQSWFTARFTVTTFTNEMKWYFNEAEEGNETYAVADAMVAFAKQHGIAVRGHNVVWDDTRYVQNWVQSLPTQKLREAVNRRFNSVMTRYRGQVIAWDVVNENVHYSYYESRLGENASSIFYQQAHQLDPNSLMFLNDYNTLEAPEDEKVTPEKYLQKLQQIRSFGNFPRMAIGLEGHFTTPDISYMRSALDKLAGANIPIWLTEVDVAHSDEVHERAVEAFGGHTEEAYSHPAVQGIVIFGVWNPKGCFSRMCLTDVNFKNLPTGDVVDKLISEWRTHNVAATTDADGLHRAELFHGEYEITINHPSSNSSSVRSLTVDSASQNNNILTKLDVVSAWLRLEIRRENLKCLAEPQRAQYGGGMVRNPEFNDGLKGWSVFGFGQIAERTSDTGNRFLATDRRSLSHQSMSQKVYLQRGMLYTFSAWLQVDQGNTTVTAIFETAKDGLVPVGAVEARSGCWSMLKGGLTAKSSGPAEFFFEVRKKTVAIQAVDANGHALPGASVSIQQKRSGFPLGCAIASTILQNKAYQSWFTSRFTVTTFENELKWPSNEPEEGKVQYADADAMLAFAKQHGIAVRGHNVVMDIPEAVQSWVQSLPTRQLRKAVNRRFNSVMPRYRGKVISWDVVNENLHYSYYEDKLGENASSIFYQQAHRLDPNALIFLNDFNTLEASVDEKATPEKYLQRLQQIRSFGNLPRMAIGLESHFTTPDISYMRSALDKLAGANVPIWLTELDVANSNESKYLEDILREAYSHPAVQGIVIWGAWRPQGCWRMCLTDNNFKNLPVGDVVDKLIFEWKSDNLAATTDADGLHRAELFHGEYKITISHPSSNSSSSVRSLTVDSSTQNNNVLTVTPPRPQYGGGIVRNPEFNDGLKGWSVFGYGQIAERTSDTGNRFLATDRRSLPHQSMSQKVYLQRGMLYTFSGIAMSKPASTAYVDQGNTTVTAIFKTAKDGFVHVGAVEARSGCWLMLKGGLTAKSSGPAEFLFESKNTSVEIWVDSVSLQPFTEDQWRAHQAESINRVRKKTVAIQAVDANGHALPGASISIQQRRSGFPLGCALKSTILQSSAYQSWFTARFTVTTFTNEMKWYSNEAVEGNETYAEADAMLAFAKQHGIAVRGHNVVWDDTRYVQNWVQSLPTQKLREAVNRRFNSVMTRYRGQVIAWDVVNENVHYSYYESRLGENASSIFYQQAHQLDPNALMFLNDYNTLEAPEDEKVTPEKYLQKLQQIRSFGNFPRMAIGLEGHFTTPDISYMRSALDKLAGANVPIWLTEVDVAHSDESKHLEDILREAYSHPAVQGIVIFGVWNPKGCFSRMCLTDVNFKNLPTGDVVDELISEWRTHNVAATTDADGLHRAELFHGEYEITINHPSSNASSVRSLTVDSASQNNNVLTVVCLAEPPRAQYGGGIVRNPEFNDGLKGWSVFGFGQIAERTSDTGNRFLATDRRSLSHQSMSQKVDQGNTTVTAIFETAKDGLVPVGAVEARSGCWSMLKGGLTAKSSGPAEFLFESKNTSVEIWVDSVSLQPFTEDQWRVHQAESINKVRKKTVAIQAVDANGHALPGASVSIQQTRSGFPLGCALKNTILQSSEYQSWFAARFTVTTFTNEMKWYSNEPVEGKETYADADAMLAFAKQHGIAVRGHNVVWDNRQYVQNWVQSLPTQKLREAVNRRFNSVMTRYRGQVIAWDVVNENVHFSYFESKLGENASSIFYQQAHQLDPTHSCSSTNSTHWRCP
ncbi:hypothetical protein MUK42_34426 [Musa troglodytarum]|uniref:GH10 domain-containing protein n=1 Tax=Musa troglodytarum TaxID=320322 RepID=A0A9E7HYY4_9LILI|nr:hypothetical protein MUK42_34426 [Musa troglodytarum]